MAMGHFDPVDQAVAVIVLALADQAITTHPAPLRVLLDHETRLVRVRKPLAVRIGDPQLRDAPIAVEVVEAVLGLEAVAVPVDAHPVATTLCSNRGEQRVMRVRVEDRGDIEGHLRQEGSVAPVGPFDQRPSQIEGSLGARVVVAGDVGPDEDRRALVRRHGTRAGETQKVDWMQHE